MQQVRKFIKVDRLLIYQFDYPLLLTNNITIVNQEKGSVKYEALASDKISSVLGYSETDNCFYPPKDFIIKYNKIYVHAIADVEIAYSKLSCLL